MADYTREEWLARRASPSFGRLQRQRSRFIHISKTPEQCITPRVNSAAYFGSRRSQPGTPYRKPA